MHLIPVPDTDDRWHSAPDAAGQEDWMLARDGSYLRLRELAGDRVLFRYTPPSTPDPADPLQGAVSTAIRGTGDTTTDPWELLTNWPLA